MALIPFQTATAANVKQQPDPELLKRLEAERDKARADKQAAEEKIKRGQEKVRRAQQLEEEQTERIQRELCAQGMLPSHMCP